MDKKTLNRSSQSQSRASAIDCKKSTEVTHKPWPRNNKKREGPSSAPKNEPYRKNAPAQRGRGQVDRRPRPRGPANYAVGGTQNTGLEDEDEPEIGSVFVPGSKKQNLNHLLNFMYPSRGGTERNERRGPQIQRRQMQHRANYRHEHDLYLRAYCQFVVKEDGDYKLNLLDPDVPIKWDLVEEIVVRSTGRSECPICLGAPVAGRVGHCGHVYCWACVLHYTAAHEKQPPPCPVCATPLHVSDMKPTRMLQWPAPAEEVTMRLVRRLRGSTTVEVAPPRGQITETIPEPILPLENINNAPYCKLFAANKEQVYDILKRERKEIEAQILAEIDTTEIVYLEQALEMLKQKEENINLLYSEEASKVIGAVTEDAPPIIYEKQKVNENKIDWFDVNEQGAACVDIVQDKVEQLNIESSLNPDAPVFTVSEDKPNDEELLIAGNTSEDIEVAADGSDVADIDKQNQAKYFYFYQADDGQQIFLNSLNVRILNASWGSLAAAPPVITGQVLHRETLPLSEQTRKHMPYTAHLPLYCSFDIVELDLQPPYVTTMALDNFSDELYRRARVRARHEREERRRERAYRRALEGPPKPDISSDVLFPPAPHSFSSSVDPPLSSEVSIQPATANESPSTSVGSPPTGPSFAKMASTSGTWRVRKVPTPPPPQPAEEEEGTCPRTLCLSDAIEAALHATPSPSSKKNKKTKHKVLFATGMQRAP